MIPSQLRGSGSNSQGILTDTRYGSLPILNSIDFDKRELACTDHDPRLYSGSARPRVVRPPFPEAIIAFTSI